MLLNLCSNHITILLGKINFRVFRKRVGPRILSLESVDYFKGLGKSEVTSILLTEACICLYNVFFLEKAPNLELAPTLNELPC